MFRRIVQHLGPVLALDSGTLTTAYVRSSWYALEGTAELDFEISATFKSGTAITSVEFEVVVSDDQSVVVAVQSVRASTGAASAEHSVAASSGSTVSDRLQTTDHRNAKYAAIQAKITGGAAAGDDAASATLSF